nr:putative iron(iii) ABC transporter, solute-binding protein [uncultured archaeon]
MCTFTHHQKNGNKFSKIVYITKGEGIKKMKKKTLAFLEIAIVLCSVFLVALPTITADQNLEMQKVSATEVTAASEDEFTLGIYGNANEDDTIDMRDTTYIKLVIFGKKPKTDLADANYDGKVSMLDVGQTKLIIVGKEKKLTFVDIFGEAETVNKPIKRLVNTGWMGVEVTRAIGARDILVAIGSQKSIAAHKNFYPEISKLPAVGNAPNCDYEMILCLKPDTVMTNLEYAAVAGAGLEKKRIFEEKLPGMPVISLNMREAEILPESVRTLGYILDKENEAEEFANWIEGYMSTYKSRTEGLSENEKPRIYMESDYKGPYHAVGSGCNYFLPVLWTGGRNILDELVGPYDPGYTTAGVEVDPEWVMVQNPDIIFLRRSSAHPGGYETDDPSEYATLRQEILNRPELANINAVKNRRIYVGYAAVLAGPSTIFSAAYIGKELQPDLFVDIDPQAIHQEYVDRFCHIDFNVKEHGVFFYPPPEESR